MDIYAHRGASHQLPQHTIEAYELALIQGADRLEIDLVATGDGILIARHDATLDASTNVAAIFDDSRISTKMVDGVMETGYFVCDFTFAEIQTLKARQTNDYRDASFDNQFFIPSFQQVLELVAEYNQANETAVGIFPEIKNPTFHKLHGLDIELLLVNELATNSDILNFEVDVQAFELEALLKFDELAKNTGLADIGVHLATYYARETSNPDRHLSFPHDLRYNFAAGNNLKEIYGVEIIAALGDALDNKVTFFDLVSPSSLEALKLAGIDGISYWLRDLIKREKLDEPVDLNSDGNAEVNYKYTGEISTVVQDALNVGLEVVTFTPKDEEHFQSLGFDGSIHIPAYEVALLATLGSTAVVVDNTLTARQANNFPVSEKFVIGTGYDDDLKGSQESEFISSGDGSDRVFSGKGDDVVFLGQRQ